MLIKKDNYTSKKARSALKITRFSIEKYDVRFDNRVFESNRLSIVASVSYIFSTNKVHFKRSSVLSARDCFLISFNAYNSRTFPSCRLRYEGNEYRL